MVMQNEIEGRKSRPRSADGDWGAPMQRSSPSILSSAERGGKEWVWNEIEAHRIKVEEGIEERGQKWQYRALNEISQPQSRLRRAEGIEDRRRGLRSAYYRGRAPVGGEGVWGSPTMCNLNLMSSMASAEMQSVTAQGQNLPRYSSSENITVTFFPVAYSDSAQWIAAATSANVCGVRGWKNCDVVGWCTKLLAVKKNWW